MSSGEAVIEKARIGWWVSFRASSLMRPGDGHWHLTMRGVDRCVRREARRRARAAQRAKHNQVRPLSGGAS